jgi:hypothetical protein
VLLKGSVRAPLTLALASFCVFSCAEPLSEEECGSLLDRYVAVLAGSDRPGTTDSELVRLKAQAREKAAHDPSFRKCASRVSRSQFQCAMKADSADRLEQCLL